MGAFFAAHEVFPRAYDYEFTADILYYGTTEQVLKNMQEKIVNFKKTDCLVIMCGGSDYNITPINNILNFLEIAVKNLTHTNVIICDIPYSVNDCNKHYNIFVNKLNSAIHQRFSNMPHVWLQPTSIYVGKTDYQNDGNQLNYRGKYKLAQCINKILKAVNYAFYNSCTFL